MNQTSPIPPMIAATNCLAPGGPSLTGYKYHHCPCEGCLAANRAYNNRRYRLRAYGQWQALVEAQPVREHVQSLRDHYGIERIAELSGVAYATVNSLIHPIRGVTRTHVRKQNADALLAVQPSLSEMHGGRPVDATGTHRRIQALVSIGHPLIRQSQMLGRDRHFATAILARQQVTVATARLVSDLYARLSNQPRSDATGQRARRFAASRGWAPPAAWDDIDNPDEQPQGVLNHNQRKVA
ncbi:hypothetical protein AB0B63_18470 [Micromonospora sp. NPDC049081]|uniref:hypothetical protein n=1 Tax=Micromonospora sp. NPDC049081 TaxID=3155150 RepID=UPI0033FDCC8D